MIRNNFNHEPKRIFYHGGLPTYGQLGVSRRKSGFLYQNLRVPPAPPWLIITY